ncbi:hypothetical protein LINGRAHAP2_LOCUS4279 [Linum grandiflorum]
MERVWRLGILNMEIQLDSMTAISLFQSEGPCYNQHATLVMKFRRLLFRNWLVRLRHVYREANHAADFLATRTLLGVRKPCDLSR